MERGRRSAIAVLGLVVMGHDLADRDRRQDVAGTGPGQSITNLDLLDDSTLVVTVT